jgi:hypothetical protein
LTGQEESDVQVPKSIRQSRSEAAGRSPESLNLPILLISLTKSRTTLASDMSGSSVRGKAPNYQRSTDTFCAALKLLVSKTRAAFREIPQEERETFELAPTYEEIVVDIYNICQNDRAMSALCMYIACWMSNEGELQMETEEAIKREPWGKIGEKAYLKFDRFVECVSLEPLELKKLNYLIGVEQKYHLHKIQLIKEIRESKLSII